MGADLLCSQSTLHPRATGHPEQKRASRVRRACARLPGDRTVLRHNHIAEAVRVVWGTPQRWRKSIEGCRMV